jgi:putative redox protein
MAEAKVVWTAGKQLVGECGSGHALVLDTSKEAGGRNTGPSPMEAVLVGLVGCTALDVVFILGERMKKTVTGVEVSANADRADAPPKVYTKIEVTYRIRGRGIQEKDAARAIRLSAETYCSVAAMLNKTAKITSRYELLDEDTGKATSGAVEDGPA